MTIIFYCSILFTIQGGDKIKTYIVLDESGAMHLKNERFFVIAGFVTKELHKVKSVHKKVEELVKEKKNIPINQKVELKSSKIIPIAIIVDKDNLSRFAASENVAYNFFVKNLLKYLFNCNISSLKTDKIELRVDNRNNSVKTLKDLESFLTWEFELRNIDITVKYLDSKNNREVQMADYVANMFCKKYNSINNTLPPKVTKIYKTKMSRFPINKFGKNPSIKEKCML